LPKQTQKLIRGVLAYLARSVLLRELTVRAAKKAAPSYGAESLSRVQVLFCLFVEVVNYGGVFGSVNLVNRCGFRVAMPSPTIRPREQADLARFRSFVVSRCGFGFDVTG